MYFASEAAAHHRPDVRQPRRTRIVFRLRAPRGDRLQASRHCVLTSAVGGHNRSKLCKQHLRAGRCCVARRAKPGVRVVAEAPTVVCAQRMRHLRPAPAVATAPVAHRPPLERVVQPAGRAPANTYPSIIPHRYPTHPSPVRLGNRPGRAPRQQERPRLTRNRPGGGTPSGGALWPGRLVSRACHSCWRRGRS